MTAGLRRTTSSSLLLAAASLICGGYGSAAFAQDVDAPAPAGSPSPVFAADATLEATEDGTADESGANGVGEFVVGFGPYIGGGQMSNGAKVRHTSGYVMSLERNFAIGRSFTLGPRVEVGNGFVNARASGDGETDVATYDNRIVAGGVRLARSVGTSRTFAQSAYMTAVVGRGYSKLSIDETTDRTYKQSLYGGINGTYVGTELGAWIPLKGSFGLNLAALASSYTADQSEVGGTYQGDEIGDDGSLSLVEGTWAPEDGSLDDQVTMRTFALKVGLSLGF
jgi:hypothetical protein